jgi:uncharacterized protein YceK
MKSLLFAFAIIILSGCATSTPVYESTLADGTVVRAQLTSE